MKKSLALIILIVIALAGCGKQEEQKGQTTGAATPPPAQVTMDSIAAATPQNLEELMEHLSQSYGEMGQKVEAGNFGAAQKAWETQVAYTKAIGNFKADKPGPNFEKNQQDMLNGLDEIGKLIASQDVKAAEKIAALSKACDACHKEYRK